jgi:hypothetical protein
VTPAADHGAVCADVGTLRACWDAQGTPSLVARTLPLTPAASPLGWRCAWPGPTRLCVDRRAGAAAFTCVGERCTQSHARRPDDGEWTCVDSAGAVACVGGQGAAGIVAGPPDVAWICGKRPDERPGDAFGSRVCVDLAPDFPDGDGTHWRCRSFNGPAGTRECARATDVAVLGVRCDGARPCVDGAACVGALCVPARPEPSCWLDDDCPSGACRFGTCRAEGTP